MRACVVGSTNVDLVLAVPVLPAPGATVLATGTDRRAGGKGANQASALVRLGAEVVFVSAVGADAEGEWSLAQLSASGVCIDDVASTDGVPTGLALVMVDPAGENAIVVHPGANHRVQAPVAIEADVVLLSLEIPLQVVIETARRAAAAGIPVVLNAAPACPLPAELLRAVTVLVVNEDELAVLGGDPVALRTAGPAAVVVTLGADGALLVQDATIAVPAVPIEVVDTTGAGDCFAAALAYGIGVGWDLLRAVQLATASGALAVAAPGARGGQPTLAQARALLAGQGELLA